MELRLRVVVLGIVLVGLGSVASAVAGDSDAEFEEVKSMPAAEANQAVAVDAEYVYAIDSHAIGKYDKETGEKVDEWSGGEEGRIHHLNSGVVVDGTLYCAHSNFPGVPMVSSIEMWDVETMEHTDSHAFGIYEGSATWIDYHDGDWWVVFAHYEGDGGLPNKGPEWTRLVRMDEKGRRKGGWAFPPELIERFRPYSNSGGAWGPDGRLYVTGHDAKEVYVLERPEAGATLQWVETLEFPGEGQGVAWDPAEPNVLYGIRRSEREIVAGELAEKAER